jgi:hypothetical protein
MRIKMITMMALTSMGLFGLVSYAATEPEVSTGRKPLTPQERIEKLGEIKSKYEAIVERKFGEDKVTIVFGTIRTHNGRPVPPDCRIIVTGIREGKPIYQDWDVRISDGSFWWRSWRIFEAAEKVCLRAQASGYSPAFAGPMEMKPGSAITDVEVVLGRGFEGQVRVVDEANNPMAGAHLSGGYIDISGLYTAGLRDPTIRVVTDDSGVASVDHCGDRPIRFGVMVNGYQYDEKELELKPDKVVEWQIKLAKVTTGVVVSEETGEPIAGATLGLVEATGPFKQIANPYEPLVVTETDKQGRFALNSLRDDSTYHFIIRASGYGVRFPYEITAGQKLKIEMGKELYVRGKIIGALERLSRYGKKPVIGYWNQYKIGEVTHTFDKSTEVEIRDGVGYFEISSLWPDKVIIYPGRYHTGERVEIDISEGAIDDAVIELGLAKPTERIGPVGSREVVVRFDVGEAEVLPSGSVWVSYMAGDENRISERGSQPIENGEVRLEVPVPCRIIVYSKGMIGYWFDAERFEISVGQEPLVLTLPVVPAGSIYGEVLEPDGSPAKNVDLDIVTLEPSPLMPDEWPDVEIEKRAEKGVGENKFMAGPLPLGAAYAVIVKRKPSYIVKGPIKVDESEPIKEISLKFPEGVKVSGRILGPDGEPMGDLRFSFGHGFGFRGYSWASSGGSYCTTDKEGRFMVEHVNPNIPGHYLISVREVPNCRPFSMDIEDLGKPLTIRLERGYAVSGVVIDDATGYPVPGAHVRANSCDGTDYSLPAESVTNERGEFRFSNMGKKEYKLSVLSAEPADESNPPVVVGGQTDSVTVRIKIREGSLLTPRKPHRYRIE